jgi:two-component system OmpR family response regulator
MDTVLIVDDDPDIREIFTLYLEMEGFRTIAVSGGRECLDLLRTCIPDLVLLDLMMEPMDGWETLRAIREYPAAGQVPVIIITGKQPVPEDIARYGSLIEDFMVKPVEFDQFVASLPATLDRVRALNRSTAQKRAEGQDPELVAEYIHLLQLVRITRNLIRRFANLPWADRVSLKNLEDRLLLLHARLGFPDQFLEGSE